MARTQISSDDHGMLYIVAMPIGNLGDITLRAIEVLKSVDAVAAEDTRYSGMLLKHFGIKKPLVSFHQHNEAMRTAQLIDRLAANQNIAVITDAGMPGLSDPGARLIRECIRRDLLFTIVPGPSSILTAIVGSGFSTEKFFFGGFLPVKSGGRERELRAPDGAARPSYSHITRRIRQKARSFCWFKERRLPGRRLNLTGGLETAAP